MTVLGQDQPGLVRALSDAVANQGGNWLESRMARLAGQFAGIVRVECPSACVDGLLESLRSLESKGLSIHAVREEAVDCSARQTVTVEVLGNDRPGIVRELAAAIGQAGGNVEELVTDLESAAMTGQPLFRARGVISLAEGAGSEALINAIESLGGDLTVDLVHRSPSDCAFGIDKIELAE
jgi:glycine cleavage system regulatory protein